MNKKILSLLALVTLVGCQSANSSSSNVNVSTSTNSSSSTTTSSSSTSSSSSSTTTSNSSTSTSSSSSTSSSENTDNSSIIVTPVDFLQELKLGFVTKGTYSKQYNNDNPSLTFLKTYVGDGVAKWSKYNIKSWDEETEDTVPYEIHQYEKDSEENAQVVSYNTKGEVLYTPLLLKDPITQSNAEAFWSETLLDNAFALLTNDDFIKVDQKTYSLDLSDEKLEDDDYSLAVKSLAIQMYMILEGSEYVGFTFVDTPLESYTITLDDNNIPKYFDAKFESVEQPDAWGYGVDTINTSVTGEFISLGNDSVKKLENLSSNYEELDKAFESLREHNYGFSIKRSEKGDGQWSSDVDMTYVGKADGLGNIEVEYNQITEYQTSSEHFGYRVINESSYRKYLIEDDSSLWNGDVIEGTTDGYFPSFPFNSSMFVKNEEKSTATESVYTFINNELLNEDYSTDRELIRLGYTQLQGWSLRDFEVTLTESGIEFYNYVNETRSMEASFTNIGKVEEINATVSNIEDLVIGKFCVTGLVRNTEVTFEVTITSDGVAAIYKDGEHFGSYGYTINDKYQIVLDEKVEKDTFTIVDDSINYICKINKTLKFDNPYNPTSLTIEVKSNEEGKTLTKTYKLVASRYVEPTPVYYFEFTLPTWDPIASAPKFYYWGKDAENEFINNSITWEADGNSNMTLVEGNTYYYEVDASITLDGIIIAFEQNGEFKQSVDVVENLPTEAGKYEVISTYSDWSTNKFDGVYVQEIVEVSATYMKDSEDSYVVQIYYDLHDFLLGEKADYIPFIPGIENCVDIIWTNDDPEGFYYSITDAPENYTENYKSALTSIYGYTETSENVYENEETGLKISLVEEDGYQYVYLYLI